MELTKNLAQWRDQSPEQWITQANRVLPPLAVAVIVVLIALLAVDLTWTLLDSPAELDAAPPAAVIAPAGASGRSAQNLAVLDAWRPFGTPPVETEQQGLPAGPLLDAPETTLPLRLHGLVEVQDLPERDSIVIPEAGSATISSGGGRQKTYHTGDTIENASGAKLQFVFADRVVLDRGGRPEALFFPSIEEALSSTSRSNSRIAATPQRAQPVTGADPATLLGAMTSAASILTQNVQIIARTESGQTIGYSLQPRGDSQIFSQLGLEPGDVLTEVNGIRLDNINNTMQILQALGEAPQASVTIRRNGVNQAMVLDMSLIERLSQSQQ
jgi:general secretion pathway protein C